MGATPGGSITVNVGPNDSSITVTDSSTGDQTKLNVAPGKDTTIPIPNVPGGTILHLRIGSGFRARCIVIEVIAPGP